MTRTAAHRAVDKARGDSVEQRVRPWLGSFVIDRSHTQDELDFYCPGVYAECKAKFQKLNAKWHLLPGVPEVNLFVLDELSLRRAALKLPHSYFILCDEPNARVFLARTDEVLLADRVRVNRQGPPPGNVLKGKVILDVTQFRLLADPASELLPAILADQVSMEWKSSACLPLNKEVPVL